MTLKNDKKFFQTDHPVLIPLVGRRRRQNPRDSGTNKPLTLNLSLFPAEVDAFFRLHGNEMMLARVASLNFTFSALVYFLKSAKALTNAARNNKYSPRTQGKAKRNIFA